MSITEARSTGTATVDPTGAGTARVAMVGGARTSSAATACLGGVTATVASTQDVAGRPDRLPGISPVELRETLLRLGRIASGHQPSYCVRGGARL